MEQVVYLNGSLVPVSEARISPFDHGFLYGYGLFETMRSCSGAIFRLRRHIERLGRSAEVIGIGLGPYLPQLEEACYGVLRANGLGDARVRLTVSAGEGEAAPTPPTTSPTVFITAQAYLPPSEEAYEKGYRCTIASTRQNSFSPLARLKSASYLANLMARREARAAGADEALLLNERGMLAEGSVSNIFLVRGDTLVTPHLGSGVLAGITREAVIELAQAMGMEAAEGEVSPGELEEAGEAFLTNSLWGLMPVAEVGGGPIGGGRRGEVTGRLTAAYRGLVERETGRRP